MGNRNTYKSIALFVFAGLLSATIIFAGCGSSEETSNTMPTRDINTVMEAHTQELMAMKGVVGVAIGENEEKKPCIMILVVEATDEFLEKLPKVIEGHPVCPLESGEIKPMSGS